MIKLTGVELQNFLSYKQAKFDFEDLGLCLIHGVNKDASDDSNGSGKSTILSAVCWCLFSRTIKGLTGDDVINWDAGKNCMVRLDFELEGNSVTIQRFRKYDDIGDAVRISINGSVQEGKPTEMQDSIHKLIGSDYETFINTAIYSSDTAQLLGSATDSQRRAVFGKLLNLERYERAYKIAREKRETLTGKLDDLQSKVKALHDQILHREILLKEQKEKEKSFEKETREKVKGVEQEITALPKQKIIKGKKREVEDLGKKLDDLHPEQVNMEASELLGEIRSETKQAFGLEADLAKLPNKCPMCKRIFTETHRAKQEENIRSHIGLLREELKKKTKRYEELKVTIEEIHPIRTRLFELEKEITEIESHNRVAEANRDALNRYLTELKTKENIYTKIIAELQQELENVENNKRSLEKQLAGLLEVEAEFEVLTELFGKKGIPSYVIENSFSFIQEQANSYLTTLTGGAFEVALESERTLASGAKKEEITLRVFHNGREISYLNASDGERQRLNLALLLAINAYCRNQTNLDFLLLDEVLDLSLDATGVERVITLLKEIGREVGTIFVITHKEGLKDEFDSILRIVKENGESRIL